MFVGKKRLLYAETVSVATLWLLILCYGGLSHPRGGFPLTLSFAGFLSTMRSPSRNHVVTVTSSLYYVDVWWYLGRYSACPCPFTFHYVFYEL